MTEVRNFSIEEFEFSEVATRFGYGNRVPEELRDNAAATLQMLQRIRDFLSSAAGVDVPVFISSGYRSPRVNLAVGGGAISDHIQAMAADWTAPKFGTPLQVCQALESQMFLLGIGQLIHEFGRWVHTSSRPPQRPVNRVLTITRSATRAGIHQV